jgi:hypothetical protein
MYVFKRFWNIGHRFWIISGPPKLYSPTIPYEWVKLNKKAIELRVLLKKDGFWGFLP